MFRFKLLGLVLAVVVLISGCGQRSRTESPPPLCMAGGEVEAVMKDCEKVLGEMDFRIAKFDLQLGVIRSKPLEGGQFFELWRKDNADRYEKGLSNLHSVRREVQLTIGRSDGGGVCVDCQVMLSRFSIPEKQLGNTGKAYNMISENPDDRAGFIIEQQQREEAEWIQLRRDAALEVKILERIEKKISSNK